MTREQRDSILEARGTKRNISKIETNEDATEQGNANGSGTDPTANTPTMEEQEMNLAGKVADEQITLE